MEKDKCIFCLNLVFVGFFVLSVLLLSCDKDPYFNNGDYLYTNEELTKLENIGGILIEWSTSASEEQKEVVRDIAASMVNIQGGTFVMGSENDMAFPDESPLHQVTVSDFRMAKSTITRKQWRIITGIDLDWPANFGDSDDLPATNMTYHQICEFIAKLNHLAYLNFRLPTEAEWEFAARGGNESHGFLYSGSDNPDVVAWHQGNASNKLHRAGELQPNELELFDMSGNVWELCSDYYGVYSSSSQTNPIGPSSGVGRVVRGGSISFEAAYSRVTQRNTINNASFVVGFRLAMNSNK